MMVTGTRSGKKSAGRRVVGSTGATLSGNESVAAAAIKLDFPVARSPAMTTRMPVRRPELEYPAETPGIETKVAKREREELGLKM